MPNRIIKESICVSDTINALSWFEECLFYRLIVNCDDFGRFDARPAIIKGRLFPLKERLTLRDINDALKKLAAAGCVWLYECDGKPYLQLPTWSQHQSPRAKNSKFPAPKEEVHALACTCMQMQANVPDNDNDNDKRYSGTINDTYSPAGEVAELFNSVCKALPKVVKMTESRKKKIRICAEKIDNAWEPLFQKVAASDFLLGKDGGWRATFDWIIDKDHPIKILEGNYDNRSENSGRVQHQGLDDMAALAMQRLQNGGTV